jgi:hypothetical protein
VWKQGHPATYSEVVGPLKLAIYEAEREYSILSFACNSDQRPLMRRQVDKHIASAFRWMRLIFGFDAASVERDCGWAE